MILAVLCFWCSPVAVHCHFVGGQDVCYAKPRDKKEHSIVAYGLEPGVGVKISGGGEMSWTIPSSNAAAIRAGADPTKITVFQPPVPVIKHIQIDGKIRKVKR